MDIKLIAVVVVALAVFGLLYHDMFKGRQGKIDHRRVDHEYDEAGKIIVKWHKMRLAEAKTKQEKETHEMVIEFYEKH